MPLHPLHVMSWDDPHDAEILKNSMQRLNFIGRGEWVAFSYAWAASLMAHAGRPGVARTLLNDYAEKYVTENTFNMQGPQQFSEMSWWDWTGWRTCIMTIEGGFGAANALQDMLLQSHHGIIHVFPATPPAWPAASFWQFRAEGAFLVSSALNEGRVKFVHIHSLVGGTCRIRGNFASEEIFAASSANSKSPTLNLHAHTDLFGGGMPRRESFDVGFDTVAGEDIVIWSGTAQPDCTISPLLPRTDEINYYGIKKTSRW